jgi:predicted deacylase
MWRFGLWSLLLVCLLALVTPAVAGPPYQDIDPAVNASAAPEGSLPPVVDFILGYSTQGRPIEAVRIGEGPRKLVIVGATHGWPERNTYDLSVQLAQYFRANPLDVPDIVRLYIVPLLNPDGLELRRRQNANDVDLNRNMDTSHDACPQNNWRQRAAGAYGIEGNIAGPYAESEVESRLIRDFLLDADGVIFLHSAAGVVFPSCAHPPSDMMAQIYAEAAKYLYIPEWDRYQITGGMHDWASGLGIAAITPELVSGTSPETEQNLQGLLAVLRTAEQILPVPESNIEDGIEVQSIIWRAWKAWGGQSLFGLPIAPATQTGEGWSQIFERAILQYRPDQSDTTLVVQLEPLEYQQLDQQVTAPQDATMSPPFYDFWYVNGGTSIFGTPITPEEQAVGSDGRPVIRQYFERAILERSVDVVDSSGVSLAPLGRLRWAQLDHQTPETAVVAR